MRITRLEHERFDWILGAGGAAEVRRVAEAAQAADGREVLNEAAVLTLRHRGLGTGVLLLAEEDHPLVVLVPVALRLAERERSGSPTSTA